MVHLVGPLASARRSKQRAYSRTTKVLASNQERHRHHALELDRLVLSCFRPAGAAFVGVVLATPICRAQCTFAIAAARFRDVSFAEQCGLPVPRCGAPIQTLVLDILFHVFRLPPPKVGSDPFSRDTTPEANSAAAAAASTSGSTMELPSRTLLQRHNLLDNYLAALLIAFIDSNLFEVLIELNQRMRNEEHDDSDEIKAMKKGVALKATVLIGELLHLSNTLLPTSHCARLQVRHACDKQQSRAYRACVTHSPTRVDSADPGAARHRILARSSPALSLRNHGHQSPQLLAHQGHVWIGRRSRNQQHHRCQQVASLEGNRPPPRSHRGGQDEDGLEDGGARAGCQDSREQRTLARALATLASHHPNRLASASISSGAAVQGL